MAGHKLEIAEKDFEHESYESALINIYSSMFHSARALLFRDGYKERSHFAIFVFLNEKYSDKPEKRFLNELNSLRLQRHELMYGLTQSTATRAADVESAIDLAQGFMEAVEKLIR